MAQGLIDITAQPEVCALNHSHILLLLTQLGSEASSLHAVKLVCPCACHCF